MKVLGIDIGTQSAKAVIVEGARTRPSSEYTLGCVASAEVQFDEELPQVRRFIERTAPAMLIRTYLIPC